MILYYLGYKITCFFCSKNKYVFLLFLSCNNFTLLCCWVLFPLIILSRLVLCLKAVVVLHLNNFQINSRYTNISLLLWKHFEMFQRNSWQNSAMIFYVFYGVKEVLSFENIWLSASWLHLVWNLFQQIFPEVLGNDV